MRLKELRQEKGLSQTEVAKALNTSQRNIGRWENNENEPTATFISKLAMFFEVSTDYILGLEDDFGARTAVPMADGLTSEEREIITLLIHTSPLWQRISETRIKVKGKNMFTILNENYENSEVQIAMSVLSIILIISVILLILTIVKLVKNRKNVPNIPNGGSQQPTKYRQIRTFSILKLIIIVAIIIATIFGIIKIASCAVAPDNSDRDLNPFNRLANNSDIQLTQSDDISLSYQYTLIPNTDISGLELTFTFENETEKPITSKTKILGNVKKNQTYTFSFSVTEFSFSQLSEIRYWSCTVTGGTVSQLR